MPWSNQGGGGPWGPKPGQNGGGRSQQPPDLEDIIKKGSG